MLRDVLFMSWCGLRRVKYLGTNSLEIRAHVRLISLISQSIVALGPHFLAQKYGNPAGCRK
jgi:hypothetical protein